MTASELLNELYSERGARAKELRNSGKKIIGYFCCFVPDEIITAFAMVPYRIQGSQYKPAPFTHMINVPHMRGPGSDEFYRKELAYFIKGLEAWSGKKLDRGKL